MHRSTKQKISKETQTLNDKMDQLDLMDIYRTFHPKAINFTFFTSAHRIFSKIDHILDHKSALGKFFKNWNHVKHLFWSQCSKIRYQPQEKIIIKYPNIWRLSNTLLNKRQIMEEIKKEIKMFIKKNQNENMTTQNLWDSVKAIKFSKI